MYILLFVIFLVASIVFFMLGSSLLSKMRKENANYDPSNGKNSGYIWTFFSSGALSIVVSIILMFLICGTSFSIFTSSTIDSTISMYEEENERIEGSIKNAVESYMNFESETFANLKDEDAISLISLYPELKSDALVQQQLDLYIANNAKIKELKEERINVSKARWLLYFGN